MRKAFSFLTTRKAFSLGAALAAGLVVYLLEGSLGALVSGIAAGIAAQPLLDTVGILSSKTNPSQQDSCEENPDVSDPGKTDEQNSHPVETPTPKTPVWGLLGIAVGLVGVAACVAGFQWQVIPCQLALPATLSFWILFSASLCRLVFVVKDSILRYFASDDCGD
jgi:hypothetical protein